MSIDIDGDEWQTPLHIIELVRTVLAGIDLDPASTEQANDRVGALCYYTKEQNGLLQPWAGRVFINPPYSKINGISQATFFLKRLIQQYEENKIVSGIILTNVATDATWFRMMWTLNLCFLYNRLRFIHPDRPGVSPRYANVLGYIGLYPNRFADVFAEKGHIVRPPGTYDMGTTRSRRPLVGSTMEPTK